MVAQLGFGLAELDPDSAIGIALALWGHEGLVLTGFDIAIGAHDRRTQHLDARRCRHGYRSTRPGRFNCGRGSGLGNHYKTKRETHGQWLTRA